jgi:hypothetical protein
MTCTPHSIPDGIPICLNVAGYWVGVVVVVVCTGQYPLAHIQLLQLPEDGPEDVPFKHVFEDVHQPELGFVGVQVVQDMQSVYCEVAAGDCVKIFLQLSFAHIHLLGDTQADGDVEPIPVMQVPEVLDVPHQPKKLPDTGSLGLSMHELQSRDWPVVVVVGDAGATVYVAVTVDVVGVIVPEHPLEHVYPRIEGYS